MSRAGCCRNESFIRWLRLDQPDDGKPVAATRGTRIKRVLALGVHDPDVDAAVLRGRGGCVQKVRAPQVERSGSAHPGWILSVSGPDGTRSRY